MTPEENHRRTSLKWYYKNHKANKKKSLLSNRKRKYGPKAIAHYNSQLKKQKCTICRRKKSLGRYKTLGQDHNHETKKLRGLLCFSCNVGLGGFQDSWKLLAKASKYLRNWS